MTPAGRPRRTDGGEDDMSQPVGERVTAMNLKEGRGGRERATEKKTENTGVINLLHSANKINFCLQTMIAINTNRKFSKHNKINQR